MFIFNQGDRWTHQRLTRVMRVLCEPLTGQAL